MDPLSKMNSITDQISELELKDDQNEEKVYI